MKISLLNVKAPLSSYKTEELPEFVILTGVNGVGKTALLNGLKFSVDNPKLSLGLRGAAPQVSVSIEGEKFSQHELVYLGTDWPALESSTMKVMSCATDLKKEYDYIQMALSSGIPNKVVENLSKRGVEIKLGMKFEEIFDEFEANHRPVTFQIKNSSESLLSDINMYFLTYKADYMARTSYRGWSHEKFTELYGEEPWLLLNQLMADSDMPYQFTEPKNSDYTSDFTLTLFEKSDTIYKREIDPKHLSSGEKVILNLILRVFIGIVKNSAPRLFLLDEPDAHLHPQLTKTFIDTLYNMLVKKFKAKVIMTTHSPSTVALAPEGSVYEMSKNPTRIIQSKSKSATISLLTAGYLFVGENTKYVLVEDDDDVMFYSTIYGHLNKENRLPHDKQLVFISASRKEASGGKTVVSSWVTKLSNSGLNDLIFGLIDKDVNNSSSKNIELIERYSIENYLIDPILVFAVLLHKDVAPKINNMDLAFGDEYKLREMGSDQLQFIADYIFSVVENKLQEEYINKSETFDFSLQIVEFISGVNLKYPKWLFSYRGKDLMNKVFLPSFPANTFNFDSALLVLKKMQTVIPEEFVTLFKKIQNS